jgi:hypothetical protein
VHSRLEHGALLDLNFCQSCKRLFMAKLEGSGQRTKMRTQVEAVPEWAELALDKVEWRELLQRIAL